MIMIFHLMQYSVLEYVDLISSLIFQSMLISIFPDKMIKKI